KVNDVTRLQALVDKKKVIITEATIRDAIRLADAKGVECLPNEEIFTELARMGYEKPSTKLTFYKAFFSPQWKFLIHTILQCMSAKRTSWNEFSSSMASAFICLSIGRKFNFSKYIFDCLVRNVDSSTKFYMYPHFLQLMIRTQVGDLSSHTTKYLSLALTQKVFANMRRVGAPEVDVEDVPAAGVADEDAASVADDDVPTAVDVPSIPSPTPSTQPPPPSQDQPFTFQVQLTPPQSPQAQPPSPQHQPQPSQDAGILIDLLQNLLDTCTTLTRRGRMIADMDADVDVTLKDIAKDVALNAEIEENDEVEPVELQEVVEVVTTAKLITEIVTAVSATIIADAPQLTIAAAPTLTTTPSAARKRNGVVIRDHEETATPSTIIHSKDKSKDKGKGILDEVIDHVHRKEKEDNTVKRYQALKRKPQTEAQARKNMMIYLRNTKEQMDAEDSRALKRLSKSQEDKASKKKKLDEEVEELKKHLMIVPNDDDDVYTEATPLALKVPVVDYEIYTENNKPYYKIKRANARYTSSNLEKSKKCSWSSEGKELEAVRVMWCADYHIYYNTVDFAGREEISTYKVHSGTNA
nr:hypothetical protein [Tanacetum cinerariifolium]